MKKYKSVDEMARECFYVTREEIIGAYRVAGLKVPDNKPPVVSHGTEEKKEAKFGATRKDEKKDETEKTTIQLD
jgi:hypothetical protein